MNQTGNFARAEAYSACCRSPSDEGSLTCSKCIQVHRMFRSGPRRPDAQPTTPDVLSISPKCLTHHPRCPTHYPRCPTHQNRITEEQTRLYSFTTSLHLTFFVCLLFVKTQRQRSETSPVCLGRRRTPRPVIYVTQEPVYLT